MILRGLRQAVRAWSLLCAITFGAFAQNAPAPAPGGPPNVYYGQVPTNYNGNALVFVHGLRGVAQDWWINNDMYVLAYQLGYKTAFININLDGTANDASVIDNAKVLAVAFPLISQTMGVPKFYVVAHSKGGIDTQAAITQPSITPYVKAVFTVSSPHQGTELADWAFGPGAFIAQPLGLQTPGVFSLQKSVMSLFRQATDPVFPYLGIHFYNMAGTTSQGNILTEITGAVLKLLSPIQANDGLVTPGDTTLPLSYSTTLGLVNTNHFQTNTGSLILPRIHAQINAGNPNNFLRVDPGSGFGDRQNSFAWSQYWWKGKLYVGTGRAFLCVTAATSDLVQGTHVYKPESPDLQCAPTPEDLQLQAEIWRFTPETKQWDRVFQSPNSIPIRFDSNGNPVKYTGRDIAFRGMTAFTEPDGTEALYVGGVTASAIFENWPAYQGNGNYPPPRILRSTDGINWAPLPQAPGTFLGDIYRSSLSRTIKVRGIRSLVGYKGKLFATASDFRGVGMVIASENPKLGDNSWYQAAPTPDILPAWTLYAWNGWLYTTSGDRTSSNGYGVYKTDASGAPPYNWIPVVTNGAYQIESIRSPDALSIYDLNGALYVGSDRPTEMIRIYPDDTWDLLVGAPRNTPFGYKMPLSGLITGFGNIFNGHFWRMQAHRGRLYVGTWDWSMSLRNFAALGPFFKDIMGADVYSTTEGTAWRIETNVGFGDLFNYGMRTMQSTPYGLFIGTANPFYGTQVWRDPYTLDLNNDRTIDQLDVNIILANQGLLVQPKDPRDLDEDGKITILDARKLITQCVNPGCAVNTTLQASLPPVAPEALMSAPTALSGGNATLSWKPVPKAVSYTIYRQDQIPALDLIPKDLQIQIPELNNRTFTVADIANGAADYWCQVAVTSSDCDMIYLLRSNATAPGKVRVVGTVAAPTTTFQDPEPINNTKAIYFVKAQDAKGKFSIASNIVAGISGAPLASYPTTREAILAAAKKTGPQQEAVRALLNTVNTSATLLAKGDAKQARVLADEVATKAHDLIAKYELRSSVWSELGVLADQLVRNVEFVEAGYVPARSLLSGRSDQYPAVSSNFNNKAVR